MEQKWNIPIDSCRFFDPFFEIPFLLPLPRETRGGGERGGNCKRRRLLIKSVRDRVSLPACRRVSFMETTVASWDRCFYFQRKTNIVEGLINRGVHDTTRKRVSPPRSLSYFTFIRRSFFLPLSNSRVFAFVSKSRRC